MRWLSVGSAALLLAAAARAQAPVNPANARLAQTLGGLDGPGFAVAYNEAAGMLAVGCERGTVRFVPADQLLGLRSGPVVPNVFQAHAGPVIGLAWGGPFLASAGADQNLILWNVAEHRPAHTLSAGGIVRALATAPGGKLLASAGDQPDVQLWDPATGQPVAKLEGHADWVLALAFSSDGKRLASAGYDGVVRLWDVDARQKVWEAPGRPPPAANAPPTPPYAVFALAFSRDDKLLAVGGSDAQVHLLNPSDGKPLRTIPGHTSTVTGLAFHPSGTILASASRDATVRLWSPANGQALKTLEGHTAWVQGVTFLGHGSCLASAGADQAVRVWELGPAK
jgi:WD40 repeat protein